MRLRRFIPPAIWMALIFLGSTEHLSGEATGSLILPVLRALLPWAHPAQLEALHVAVRKTGHVIEYAILAWLWLRALASPTDRRPSAGHALAAFAISVAYAGLDELHQASTGVRTGSALDLLWDGAGAAAALGVLRFGWQGVLACLTTALLWIAAAGGTLLLLLDLAVGTPARWLWASAPLAWIALWRWRRRNRRPAPQS